MKNRIVLLGVVLFLFSACDSGNPDSPGGKGTSAQNQTQEHSSSDFIVGGKVVAESDEVKATTMVVFDSRLSSLCTGSIIEKDIIVTAAHCISGSPSDIKIGFGLNVSAMQLKPILNFMVHPGWRANFSENESASDIAIIQFNGGLPKGYRSARLLSPRYKHKIDEVAILAGYGVTKDVHASGQGRLRMTEVKVSNPLFNEYEILLDQSQGKGACFGDSGGPAFLKNKEGKLELWGVTSRGYGPNQRDCSGYSIYTKISSHSRWLKSAMDAIRK